VVEAYAIILCSKEEEEASFPTKTLLFVDSAVVGDPAVQEHLKAAQVTVMPYEDFFVQLEKLAEEGRYLAVVSGETSIAVKNALKAKLPHYCPKFPLHDERVVKKPQEIANMTRSHLEDSLSAVRLFAFLEAGLRAGDSSVCSMNEWNVCEKLEEIRKHTPGYLGPSFFTIAGYAANGAIVHYEPTAERQGIKIGTDSMLLLDFGGQYAYGGTTDTTRTVHFGTPTDEQRQTFTNVLRSHIALASAAFPKNTTSMFMLDTIARSPLWNAGENYGHGTGHGVGSLLVVHEKPYYTRQSDIVKPGMMLTIEPGLYIENKFGVRIESVGTVIDHPKYDKYLGFDIVTRVPISPKLVDGSMLTKFEKDCSTSITLYATTV